MAGRRALDKHQPPASARGSNLARCCCFSKLSGWRKTVGKPEKARGWRELAIWKVFVEFPQDRPAFWILLQPLLPVNTRPYITPSFSSTSLNKFHKESKSNDTLCGLPPKRCICNIMQITQNAYTCHNHMEKETTFDPHQALKADLCSTWALLRFQY